MSTCVTLMPSDISDTGVVKFQVRNYKTIVTNIPNPNLNYAENRTPKIY